MYQLTFVTDNPDTARRLFETDDKTVKTVVLYQNNTPGLPNYMIPMAARAPNSALHFVGFKDGGRYHNAVKTFGKPDFVHRLWDRRAQDEIMDGDVAVFASEVIRDKDGNVVEIKYLPDNTPTDYSWNDSERF